MGHLTAPHRPRLRRRGVLLVVAAVLGLIGALAPTPFSSIAPAGAAPVQVPLASQGITVGDDVACAIEADATVSCWGDDSDSALGNDVADLDARTPVPVAGLTNVVGVSAGDDFVCAWTAAGAVSCWGDNDSGQVAQSDTGAEYGTPQAVAGIPNPVVDLAAGDSHACAVTSLGQVYCWGENEWNQVSPADDLPRAVPTLIAGVSGVDQVAAGNEHVCARKTDAAVVCWGGNDYGQSGVDNATSPVVTPTTVPGLTALRIDASYENTCAVTTAAGVVCFGNDADGVLGSGATNESHIPIAVVGATSGIRDLDVGDFDVCVTDIAGAAKCWGRGVEGQLGNATRSSSPTPTAPVGLTSGVRSVAAGYRSSCALLVNGGLRCWGDASTLKLGRAEVPEVATPTDVPGLTTVAAISGGDQTSCATLASGAMRCWGENSIGEVGDGTLLDRATPTAVSGVTSAQAVDVGTNHACLRNSGGGLRCWGSGPGLGTGTNAESTPTAVVGLANSAAFSVGDEITCSISTSGALACWGKNYDGQVGDGTTTSRSAPVAVVGLGSGVVQVSAGARHACAVLGNGTVACWGANGNGQLGNGTNTNSSVPVTVTGIASGATQVAVGYDSTCAVVAGAVKCWGGGFRGQLGRGTTASSNVPVATTLTSGQVQVTATLSTACARSSSGSVSCWGYGARGTVGNGGLADVLSPVAVATGIASIDGDPSGDTMCARTTTSTATCWGDVAHAQGGFDPGWTPKPVAGSWLVSSALWSPHASWAALVNQQYTDLLATTPSAATRSTWVARFAAGTHTPGDLVAALRLDPGQATTVDSTTRLYYAYFLRIPDKGGLNFWIGRKRNGYSLRTISDEFARSSEFTRRYGSLTNAQFVELIYENLFDREPDASGGTYWTNRLNTGRETRGGVMAQFSESSEYKRQMANDVTTSVLFLQLLGRAPSIEEFDEAKARLAAASLTTATLADELFQTPTYRTRFP